MPPRPRPPLYPANAQVCPEPTKACRSAKGAACNCKKTSRMTDRLFSFGSSASRMSGSVRSHHGLPRLLAGQSKARSCLHGSSQLRTSPEFYSEDDVREARANTFSSFHAHRPVRKLSTAHSSSMSGYTVTYTYARIQACVHVYIHSCAHT